MLVLAGAIGCSRDTPAPAQVVVVVMENQPYGEVRNQPYIASLIPQGTLFTHAHGVAHPSLPNYLALWAGSTLGVTSDTCPPGGAPFAAENLGHACEAAGRSWRAYCENLPSVGATGCSYDGGPANGLYTRKHAPWTYFSNLNHARERPFDDLARDIAAGTLPDLAFIVPSNCHNTHNGSPGCSVADGDAWLAAHVPAVIGALRGNGVLILTWDEDDGAGANHVLTLLVGPAVARHGVSARPISHYTVARTIAALLRVPASGQAAAEAPIEDIWAPRARIPTAVAPVAAQTR